MKMHVAVSDGVHVGRAWRPPPAAGGDAASDERKSHLSF